MKLYDYLGEKAIDAYHRGSVVQFLLWRLPMWLFPSDWDPDEKYF